MAKISKEKEVAVVQEATQELQAYNVEINKIGDLLDFVETIDENNFIDESSNYLDIEMGVQYTYVCHGLTKMKDTIKDDGTFIDVVDLENKDGKFVNADVKLVSTVRNMIAVGKEFPCVLRFFFTQMAGKDKNKQYKDILVKSLSLAKLSAPATE